MGIRQFYQNLRERIRNFLGINKHYLTEEQRNYILAGISPNILKRYNIIYSPGEIYFKVDENGTKIGKGLELTTLKSELDESKKIELDHLKKLTQTYSSIVENYNKNLKDLSSIRIKDNSNGSIEIILEVDKKSSSKKKSLDDYLPTAAAFLFFLSGILLLTPHLTGFAVFNNITKSQVNLMGLVCVLSGISCLGVFVRLRRKRKSDM